MKVGPARPPALMLGLTLLVVPACIETAVSAGERMVKSCDEFAQALEAGSERAQLDELKEARHWADLAAFKDEELEFAFDAFDRLVEEAEEDDEDRNLDVVIEAVGHATEQCVTYADPEVNARIASGRLEFDPPES